MIALIMSFIVGVIFGVFAIMVTVIALDDRASKEERSKSNGSHFIRE